MLEKILPGNINHYYSRLLQEIAFRTGGSFGKPTGMIVLLTNRCNSRCLHCYSWRIQSAENEMTTQDWQKTFGELRRWLGPIFVSITGGETLLRKDSMELVTSVSQLGFWVEFLTNGYLVNSEVAQKLVRSGAKRIKISLDGSKHELHDTIRGRKGFYLRATAALRLLATEKGFQKKGLQIWAKTTIMDMNLEDLPDIVNLTRQLGIDGVEFQALEPTYYTDELRDPKWYVNNPLWVKRPEKVAEVMEKLRDLKAKGNPIINSIENLNMIENYFHNPERLAYKVHSHQYGKEDTRCRSWIGALQVLPDGGMKMCHWMNPFAYAKNGNPRQAWKTRDQCWKRTCPYIGDESNNAETG